MSATRPSITLKKATATSAKADAVVIGVFPGASGLQLAAGADDVDRAFGGRLTRTLTTLGAKGAPGEVTLLPSGGALTAAVVVAVGLGSATPTPEELRRAAGAVLQRLQGSPGDVASVALALPGEDATAIGAVTEGALLGAYVFDTYRSGERRKRLAAVTVLSDLARDKAAKEAVRRAEAVADAVALARDWVNTPASDLHPAQFVSQAKTAAKGSGLSIEVLDEKALAKGGYGGILGVGQGAEHPPRLLKVAYRHPRAKQHLAYVGKGITFDTGGLSLKPADAMMTMKCDMGGAAAVVAAVGAIAALGLRIDVTAWAPLAENMPSGSAVRPSDVLTIYGGKTVEVLNTDAEGRLVLADALVRASEDKPDLVVDVATLTGACVVALGNRVFGVLGNDDEARERVHRVAGGAGESSWPLPIPDNTRERLDSKIADLANVAGDRWGGALVAGAFLQEFVGEGVPWVHLDIAGPAFNDGQPHGYTPKGGTGVGVRTLVALAEDVAAAG